MPSWNGNSQKVISFSFSPIETLTLFEYFWKTNISYPLIRNACFWPTITLQRRLIPCCYLSLSCSKKIHLMNISWSRVINNTWNTQGYGILSGHDNPQYRLNTGICQLFPYILVCRPYCGIGWKTRHSFVLYTGVVELRLLLLLV